MTEATKSSNHTSIAPPNDVALPKITPEIWESYEGEEFIEDSPRWGWTQAAVDFAAEVVRPVVQAELKRRAEEIERLQQKLQLAGFEAFTQGMRQERLRAIALAARNLVAGARDIDLTHAKIDKAALVALETALAEAMEWNWLDPVPSST